MSTFKSNTSIEILLIAVHLTVVTELHAQFWPTINTADTVNFKLSNNLVPMPDVTVWVVSQELAGNDTILHLNTYAKNGQLNQPGFLQKKVTITPNGLVMLTDPGTYNLYPSAGIGTTWIFKPLTQITAVVTAITSEVILGLPDSVKTISLSDGKTVKLSKRWGILSFPDYSNGKTYNLVGIDNLRIGEFFPNHVDFALGLEVGDMFKTSYSFSEYSISPVSYSNAEFIQYTIGLKTINDTSVEYQVYGIKKSWFSSGGGPEWRPTSLYTGKLTFPLTFTAFQKPDKWSRLRDKYSNDTIDFGDHYAIVYCYYDNDLKSIGKKLEGHDPSDSLNHQYCTFKYNTCLGVPFIQRELHGGGDFSSYTILDELDAWSKSFGTAGTFFNIGLTGVNWPLISDTNIMNYQLSNNASPLPDVSIRVASKNIVANDTILNINPIVKKIDDQYLVNQPSFLQKKVTLKENRSVVLSDPHEFVIFPSGGEEYYWLFDTVMQTSAFVESVKYKYLFDAPDTVKTILLSNGRRIELSKRWGLLSYPAFENAGVTYDLIGVNNQDIGTCFPDRNEYALSWEIGDVFRTREGEIAVVSANDTIEESFTNKQFKVISKVLTDTSVCYNVDGFQWEDGPDNPIYAQYRDKFIFSLVDAPFIGHKGLGRMQDAAILDTIRTFFNGQQYIHVVEPFFDLQCKTIGKKLVSQPFQSVNNDTLVPGPHQDKGLISCEYQACPGYPTIKFSDYSYGKSLSETITKSVELIAWSTSGGSFGELISNPFGNLDQHNPSNIYVFPNPFIRTLHIEQAAPAIYQRIELYNNTGLLVFSSDLTSSYSSFNLSNLAEGMYIMKAISSKGTITLMVAKAK